MVSNSPAPAHDRLLRISQIVPALVPVSRSTVWRWVRKGIFPPPVRAGMKLRLWHEADVQAWILDPSTRARILASSARGGPRGDSSTTLRTEGDHAVE